MSHPLIAKILCCVHKVLISGIKHVFMWVAIRVGLADYRQPMPPQSSPIHAHQQPGPSFIPTTTH